MKKSGGVAAGASSASPPPAVKVPSSPLSANNRIITSPHTGLASPISPLSPSSSASRFTPSPSPSQSSFKQHQQQQSQQQQPIRSSASQPLIALDQFQLPHAAFSPIARPFSATQSNPDFVQHSTTTTYYRSASAAGQEEGGKGAVAVSVRPDGGAEARYPDGRLAVTLSVSYTRDTIALTSFLYDRDSAHTLLGSFDTNSLGDVREATGKYAAKGRAGRKCFEGEGGKNACSCKSFKVDPDALFQCAGCIHSSFSHEQGLQLLFGANHNNSVIDRRGKKSPMPFPYELRLNQFLTFHVDSAGVKSVDFSCEGIKHRFALTLASVRFPKAAMVQPASPPPVGLARGSPSPDRTRSVTPAGGLSSTGSRSKLNQSPSKQGAGPATFSTLMEDLNSLQKRIWGTLTISHDEEKETKLFGTQAVKSSVVFSRTLNSSDNLAGLTYNEEFEHRNPALKRGTAIRSASGKYSLAQAVPPNTLQLRALPQLLNTNFDQVLNEEENRNKLIAVMCYASFIPGFDRFEKVLEKLNAKLHASSNQDSSDFSSIVAPQSNSYDNYLLYKFDLAHSRLMLERYNMRHSSILCFFNGRLVHASRLEPSQAHRKRVPMCLILEPDWKTQMKLETVIKQCMNNAMGFPWQSVLASNTIEFQNLADWNVRTNQRWEALMIDLDKFTPVEVNQIVARASVAPKLDSSSGKQDTVPAFTPLHVIGFSERSEAEVTQYLKCKLGALLPKPVNGRDLLKVLQKAYDIVCPPIGHTGMNETDLLNVFHSSLNRGLQQKYLVNNFQFRADMVEAVVAAPQRIAAAGALSSSVVNTKPAWSPPPPPPPPVVEEIPDTAAAKKGKRATKK